MLKCGKWSAWAFLLLAVLSTFLKAQNVVYTNNDQGDSFDASVQNSVSAFSVTIDPMTPSVSLSEIAGSPFPAAPMGQTNARGTRSTFYPSNRIIVVNDFLYASNAGSSTVSAFTINTDTTSPDFGALTRVDGSPFEALCFDGSSLGISLAATPDGELLYAGSTGSGQITIFGIDSVTGALSNQGCGSAGGTVSNMKVTPQKVKVGQNDEYLLAVALFQSNQVAMFEIKSDGTLAELSGSPFSTLTNPSVETGSYTAGIDINCAGNLLFAGRSGSPYIDVFNFSIDSGGVLTVTDLLPFETTRQSNQVVVLIHPDDETPEKTLFSSNPGNNTVTPFAVDMDGMLTQGDSVGAGTGSFNPGGLAVSQDGKLLYAGDVNGAISTFVVDSSSSPASLTVQPVTSTGQLTGLHSVAAYPANVCPLPQPTNTLTVNSLQVTGGPPPAFDLDATLTLDSSFGANPFLTQDVTFYVGDFTLLLPKGSFKTYQKGLNAETYLFQGVINSTTLKVQIKPLGQNESGQNQFRIHVFDKQVDLPGMGSVTVKVCIGDNNNDEDNNCPSDEDVTSSFPSSLRGNWRDF